MKSLFLFISLFILCKEGHAQEKTIILSDSMFSSKGKLNLSDLDGWVFHPECGENLAPKDVNTTRWKNLKPSQMSTDHINLFGRACGWFRLRIKLDSSVNVAGLGVKSSSWAAADLYINGIKITSFGNTSEDDTLFKGNRANTKVATAINLLPDSVYRIALKIVEKNPPTPEKLAAKSSIPETLVLTNQRYNNHLISYWSYNNHRNTLSISVTAVLTLLFWFIYLLNRSEKNILRFAIGSTLLTLFSIARALILREENTIYLYYTFAITAAVLIFLFILFVPFILAPIFKGATPRLVKTLTIISGIVIIGGFALEQTLLIVAIGSTLPLLISLYYLLSSFKNLTRSRYAIVTGFLACLVFLIVSFIVTDSEMYILLSTLSPPLGMLGYVALRFKEMIGDVQASADRILALSEEKRMEAERQQVILEEEVAKQTLDLKSALVHLQDTQKQLIQSEKMASLGELTAGIAHEIQNPLNFVKNFSEVSVELLEDMIVELKEGDIDEAQCIAGDVSQNLEKIVHHGNRADNIVKGMLQHSRSGTGTKEPTAINAFVDEYVRLGHHGLSAKDKIVNVDVKTDYDQSIGKLGIMQQEMGRVILNLITNAFYAVTDKKKTADEDFVPVVSVSTSRDAHHIRIAVKDNGNGIPLEIKEKIFQPFFTTKPTGEGTGLGLSLAYDIVKVHNGELTVETSQGEGTTFTIILPV